MKLASFCVPLSSQGGGMLLPNLNSYIDVGSSTDMDDEWNYTNPNIDLVKILTTNGYNYVTSFTVTSDCWAFVSWNTETGNGMTGSNYSTSRSLQQYWQPMQKGRTYYTTGYSGSSHYSYGFRIHRNLK